MRYLFRGLIRDTGKPVVGHVEAAFPEEAFSALSENGIVTESLTPDPKPLAQIASGGGAAPGAARTEVADAIDSAFDVSATQVDFDQLTERYRGKRVWVIDREKIRRRVAEVVDQALRLAQEHSDTAEQVRASVAEAIQGLFRDTRNITSPADQVEAQKKQSEGTTVASPELDGKVDRLTSMVASMQATLANLAATVRSMPVGGYGRGGGEGGGGGRRRAPRQSKNMGQNDVLLEIFKSNMQLQRGVQIEETPAGADAAAPAGDGAIADGGADGAGEAIAATASGSDDSPPQST